MIEWSSEVFLKIWHFSETAVERVEEFPKVQCTDAVSDEWRENVTWKLNSNKITQLITLEK